MLKLVKHKIVQFFFLQIEWIGHKKQNIKWHDIQPSMVTHTQSLCSAFNPSKVHTHTAVNTHTHTHTHTVNTHPEKWAAIYVAAPGKHLGVRCLAQGYLVVVLRVKRALDIHSPHLQFLPDLRLELITFGLRVQLSTIRPQLPPTKIYTLI